MFFAERKRARSARCLILFLPLIVVLLDGLTATFAREFLLLLLTRRGLDGFPFAEWSLCDGFRGPFLAVAAEHVLKHTRRGIRPPSNALPEFYFNRQKIFARRLLRLSVGVAIERLTELGLRLQRIQPRLERNSGLSFDIQEA